MANQLLIEPVEKFELASVPGNTTTSVRRVVAALRVNPALLNRHVWVALQPVNITGATPDGWKSFGELRFRKDGQIVGVVPINLSNYSQVAAEPCFLHLPNAYQPTLRWEYSQLSTDVVHSVDLPPFYFRLACDEVELWCDYAVNTAVGAMIYLRGLRVISQ